MGSAELRYQQLFESSPLPLWVYDLETLKFLDVNEVACAKYGYSRAEFLSMTILDIRPPEDASAVMASVRDMPSNLFNAGIWRHRLKNGEIINVEITSHEMEFMARPTRFVCPIDVTQRVRTETMLRRREEALKRAQSVARLGHAWIAPGGRLEDPSENLAHLAGLKAEDLPRTVDQWIERLVHIDDQAMVKEKSRQAMSTRDRVEVEYRLSSPNACDAQIAQVFEAVDGGASDQERWLFTTLQDVTEQKRAEAQLVRQAEELEERVRQRTAELEITNRELALATAQAQQGSIAKSRFLSTVSHELRTPLNAILGFAQLLNMPGATTAAQQTSFVEHIEQAGNHLLALINELLDFAAIEAGKTSMLVEPFALEPLLEECSGLIRPIASHRRIDMFASSIPHLEVLADRIRLKQVLLNLLSNAVKYSPEGQSVEVSVEEVGQRVRISVVDRGAGLTSEQVAALYQPFNRLGREESQTQGTGIGLVVTKSLVELMNGRIGVNSVPGTGTTFWIELPIAPTSWR